MIEDWQDKLKAMLEAQGGYTPEDPATPDDHSANDKKQKSALTLFYEKKGRGGKQVTIITGFEGSDNEVAEIAGTLKKRLGTGGSSRDGEILIQGDRRNELRKILADMGYKVKN